MSENYTKLKKIFVETFEVEEAEIPGMRFTETEKWDSVAHMELIATLEDEFGIFFDTKDMVKLTSFDTVMEILKKYDIDCTK